MERVDELGDASVPFNFDVHAMIFSDDAPKLEAALHNAFADRKLNMVNGRREFFNVTLNEIEQVVKENYEKSVDFCKIASAEQFRESMKLRKHDNSAKTIIKPAASEAAFTVKSNDVNASKEPIPSDSDDSDIEYIYTKWGKYKKPVPYKINLTKGRLPY